MQFFTILKKELKGFIRNKLAFVVMFVPLFLFPAIYYFVGQQAQNTEETLSKEIKVCCVTQNEVSDFLFNTVLSDITFKFVRSDEPKEDLKTDATYLIFDFESSDINKLPIKVKISYNANSSFSSFAYQTVMSAIQGYDQAVVCEYLLVNGLDVSYASAIEVTSENLSTNALLVMIAPMLITSLLMMGGSGVATDIFAGEKERGTLEQLAATQASRPCIWFGKMTTVFIANFMSAAVSLIAYYISVLIAPDAARIISGGEVSIQISFSTVAILIACMMLFSLFISSLTTLFSLLLKNVKSASSVITFLSMLPILIGLFVSFSSIAPDTPFVMFIPIYNFIMLLRMLFSEIVIANYILLFLLSQILYVLLICFAANKTIKKSKFLL